MPLMRSFVAVAALAGVAPATVAEATGANPIRQVVNLLQNLARDTTSAGEKADDLFVTSECLCKKSDEQYSSDLASLADRISTAQSTVQELRGQLAQLAQETKELHREKADNEDSLRDAKQVREKEAKDYADEAGDLRTNIGALDVAIPKLEKTQATALPQEARAFLQRELPAALVQALRARESGAASLSESPGASSTGEILGLLKQMRTDMKQSLRSATREEGGAMRAFEQIRASKKAELAAAATQIESKQVRSARATQAMAEAEEEVVDSSKATEVAQEGLAAVRKNCMIATRDHETAVKVRNMEQAAIADAVRILNDDDALRTFDTALGPKAALVAISAATVRATNHGADSVEDALDVFSDADAEEDVAVPAPSAVATFLQTAMQKKTRFGKVEKLVDNMVASLQKQAASAHKKKERCEAGLRASAAELAAGGRRKVSLSQRASELKEAVRVIIEWVAELRGRIAGLDASLAKKKDIRTAERGAFNSEQAGLARATQLLTAAKQRLKDVYAQRGAQAKAAQVKAAPAISLLQRRRSAEDASISDMLGLSPAASPTAASLAQGSPKAAVNILDLLQTLIGDCKAKSATNAQQEKDESEDFAKFSSDADASRRAKSKSVTDKEAARARVEEELAGVEAAVMSCREDLVAAREKQKALHAECDVMLAAYDETSKARTREVEGLRESKAVLAGADYK